MYVSTFDKYICRDTFPLFLENVSEVSCLSCCFRRNAISQLPPIPNPLTSLYIFNATLVSQLVWLTLRPLVLQKQLFYEMSAPFVPETEVSICPMRNLIQKQ